MLHTVMHQKDVDGMANSVDPDHIAPQGQSDQGLHCLLRPTCPNIKNIYRSLQSTSAVQCHAVITCVVPPSYNNYPSISLIPV